MAETSQDSNQHLVEQDSLPLSSELSPDFEDVSEDTSSRQHERLQKLRTWWSKKAPTACITFPSLSDSSDSDDDFDDDDVEDVIFPSARCRVMRVVGKLSTIQENVETIYRARYGPIDLEDMTCAINLRGQRIESLDDIQWGQVMLINSVDILQSKISMVRRLFLAYKMNMSKGKSDLNQDYINQDDEACLISTQSKKRDEVVSKSELARKRHKIVRLITPQHHHDVIYRFCSLFLFLIKPSLFPDRQSEIKRTVLLEDAFSKIRIAGLPDCLNDDSWNVLDRCHLPSPSIVSRCINLSTFFTMASQDDQSPIRTVTSECDVALSPSSMISQYQDIIKFFRNTALFCAYIFRRLKVLEQELCVASKHFGEMRDKRIKNCKPLSDGDELLRRVMMKENQYRRKQCVFFTKETS